MGGRWSIAGGVLLLGSLLVACAEERTAGGQARGPLPAPRATAAAASTTRPTLPPTAPPIAQPLSVPTWVVNTVPVGCHQSPDAAAPIIAHREAGTIQPVDQFIAVARAAWHRATAEQCWVRSSGGAARIFTDRTAAEAYARSLRPTPPPTRPPAPPAPTVVAGCPRGCATPLPGCLIKGSVSVDTGERIYHVPGGRGYDETVIKPAQGDRWFCTEQEASDNGWRRSEP
jgi:hypothetical protein